MVWKRVVPAWGLLVLGAMFATAGAQPTEPQACPNFTAQIYPYGTKAGGVFVSPAMHGLRLVDMISNQMNSQAFTLSAEFPVNGVLPDFDMLAVDAASAPIQSWQSTGDEAGIIPPGTARLYVYMPVGPDTAQELPKGTFRFNQC